jgi:hypothetical protein
LLNHQSYNHLKLLREDRSHLIIKIENQILNFNKYLGLIIDKEIVNKVFIILMSSWNCRHKNYKTLFKIYINKHRNKVDRKLWLLKIYSFIHNKGYLDKHQILITHFN